MNAVGTPRLLGTNRVATDGTRLLSVFQPWLKSLEFQSKRLEIGPDDKLLFQAIQGGGVVRLFGDLGNELRVDYFARRVEHDDRTRQKTGERTVDQTDAVGDAKGLLLLLEVGYPEDGHLDICISLFWAGDGNGKISILVSNIAHACRDASGQKNSHNRQDNNQNTPGNAGRHSSDLILSTHKRSGIFPFLI